MKRYLILIFLLCILPVISGCSQTAAVDQNVAKKVVVSTTNTEATKITQIKDRTNAKIRSDENEASNTQKTGKAFLPAVDVREDSTAAASLNSINENQAKLLITRDFGKQTIFEKQLTFPNKCSILDLMQASLTIETKYGGNFVGSINGLKSNGSGFSNKQNDWFYYVNGICSSIGLADYELQNGDCIWWDYHAWQLGPANAAVVGAYPEPFVHGYHGDVKPVLILSADCSDMAENLKKALQLQGTASVTVCEISNEAIENRKGPVIVLGVWDKLKTIPYLEKLNQGWAKNGMAIHFTDNSLELLSYSGTVKKGLNDNAGVIASTGTGLGDNSPLWLLSGIDQEGLQVTIDLLVNNPSEITGMYSAAVCGSEIIRLPMD